MTRARPSKDSTANLGFEAKLWLAADQRGQFYTPQSVVRRLVEMLAPYKSRIYDPCCGSGGMFVQSEKFVDAHGGKLGDISICGQESNSTTRRLAVMSYHPARNTSAKTAEWGLRNHAMTSR